jgi:hypothetical protein
MTLNVLGIILYLSVLDIRCFIQPICGWKSFKVYHIGRKGPSPYYSPILPYILIPIRNNESKVVKNFRRNIF